MYEKSYYNMYSGFVHCDRKRLSKTAYHRRTRHYGNGEDCRADRLFCQ